MLNANAHTIVSIYAGCTGGVGQGVLLSNGIGGGGGHGGRGGDGYYNGSVAEGGVTYGNAELPCELGSGSGNDNSNASTAGGGIIGKFVFTDILFIFSTTAWQLVRLIVALGFPFPFYCSFCQSLPLACVYLLTCFEFGFRFCI